MKAIFSILALSLIGLPVFSQDFTDIQAQLDSLENSFTYQHGTITLQNGVGKITVPEGFKYLDPEQAERVLVDLWGNPKDEGMTLGFLLPERQRVMSDSGYVFNIQYDEIGYVEDDDAGDIDYENLLAEMKHEAEEANAERQELGYEPVSIIGWASTPYYDSDRKILHWAKEIKFGEGDVNTLNYNVRVLGRKGVLILNAISTMPNLSMVKRDIPRVLSVVEFNEGYQYQDFDPSVDQVAAWTIGGLVAGKVLTKVGFFAVLLKFWKVIVLAVGGFFGGFWKKFRRKKQDDTVRRIDENAERRSLG